MPSETAPIGMASRMRTVNAGFNKEEHEGQRCVGDPTPLGPRIGSTGRNPQTGHCLARTLCFVMLRGQTVNTEVH